MKFNSWLDRLLFPYRMKKLNKRELEKRVNQLEIYLEFWEIEALKYSYLYWELKAKEEEK